MARKVGQEQHAGYILKKDLKAARNAWIEESDNAQEKSRREKSDFLRYWDSQGRYADFHALRHTFLSCLGRSGASAKTMMKLGRLTTPQLAMWYTHVNIHDLSSAANNLPQLLPEAPVDGSEIQTLRATGTDDASPPVVAELVAVPSGNHRNLRSNKKSLITKEKTVSTSDDSKKSPQILQMRRIEDNRENMESGERGIREEGIHKVRQLNELWL